MGKLANDLINDWFDIKIIVYYTHDLMVKSLLDN